MYTPLKLALLALPFVTAFTTDYKSRPIRSAHRHRDVVTDIVTSASDIADQVDTALGDIIPNPINSSSLLESTLDSIRQQGFEIDVLEETFAGLLQAVVASYTPTNISQALSQIATIVNGTNSTIENAAQLILNGLATTDLTENVLAAYLSGVNSFNNVNPDPPTVIYPKKSPQDAPYTVPEAQLRAAIYIPPGFTYGQTKRPVLFVPGTGSFGGVNFVSNLGKLLANDGRFDPVYLNVPGAMYNDTQINSEYIAYAINYLGSITGNSINANNLAVIPWSQGNLDTQWVFQYWPSTRPVVTDFISVSADFHGTTLAYLLDPALVNPPLPPSIIQQEYDSNFVLTLRYGGGGSPYVNSTSVHSITDEIVQPQYSPYASADYFTLDLSGTPVTTSVCPALQNVAYTNNEIQQICPGLPAGGPYTHEGLLYNPIMYALTLDALTNDGPGRVERLDLTTICAQFVAPGLTLADVLATEGLIPLALINLLLYPGKVTNEPPIMQYALQANAQCAAGNTTTTANSSTVASTSTTASVNATISATSATTTGVSTTSSLTTTSSSTASSTTITTTASTGTASVSGTSSTTVTTSSGTTSINGTISTSGTTSATTSSSSTSVSNTSTGITSTFGTVSTGTTSTSTRPTGTTSTATLSTSTSVSTSSTGTASTSAITSTSPTSTSTSSVTTSPTTINTQTVDATSTGPATTTTATGSSGTSTSSTMSTSIVTGTTSMTISSATTTNTETTTSSLSTPTTTSNTTLTTSTSTSTSTTTSTYPHSNPSNTSLTTTTSNTVASSTTSSPTTTLSTEGIVTVTSTMTRIVTADCGCDGLPTGGVVTGTAGGEWKGW